MLQKANIKTNITASALSSVSVTLTPDGGNKINAEDAKTYYFRPDTKITYTISLDGIGNDQAAQITGSRDAGDNISKTSSASGSFYMPAAGKTVTITARRTGSCIVEGTLITLADGTQKPVEDLLPTDKVLVFNHYTGKYEMCELWSNIHAGNDADWYTITYLYFSDGTTLGINYEHGLFDKTLNKYVYFNESNAGDYIGHNFVKVNYINGEYVSGEVTLTGYENITEYVRVYSPTSLFNMDIVTNGLLSITAWPTNSENFTNIFEFDDDMKYDEEAMRADIETYGVYTYEDFKDLMTEDLFNALPWKYLKVAVGKGNITWDEILYTIEWIYTTGQIQLN